MKTLLCLALGFSAAVSSVALAADKETEKVSRVAVSYVEPEKFTDFNTSGFGTASEKDIKYLTDTFTDHLESLAKRHLAADQRLEVTFTDIDLAGRFEPEHGPSMQDIRFYRDITFPRMTLEFRLLDGEGQVLLEGKRRLTDLDYNMKLRLPTGTDELRPDLDMLTDWVRSEFKKKKT